MEFKGKNTDFGKQGRERSVMIQFIIPFKVTYKYSLNRLYSGIHWATRKKQADEMHELVSLILKAQKIDKIIDEPIELELYFNSRLDCSNHGYLTKMIEDALKGTIIKDDTKKFVRGIYQSFWDGEGIKVIIKAAEISRSATACCV